MNNIKNAHFKCAFFILYSKFYLAFFWKNNYNPFIYPSFDQALCEPALKDQISG